MAKVLIVNAPSRPTVYGNLKHLTAAEIPVWAGLLGARLELAGHEVEVLDCEVAGWDVAQSAVQVSNRLADLTVFTVYGQQPSASTQCLPAAEAVARLSGVRCIALGTHPSALPGQTLFEGPWTYVCKGEGPDTILGLLEVLAEEEHLEDVPGLWYRKNGVIHSNDPAPNIQNLDGELGDRGFRFFDFSDYRAHNWHTFGWAGMKPYASLQTSLGCSFRCLRGDTLINTIEGLIPIKQLAETRKTIPVYTYKDGRVFISDATNIKRTRRNQRLVRVRFDDGTHIDCTPDHKFLTFRINTPANGQFVETAVEAQNLEPGTRIRAMKSEISVAGRRVISWRREGVFNARMVMEYTLRRGLKKKEQVHHLDENTLNDSPGNLQLCSSAKDHFKHHPEVGERMRNNNPMRDPEIAKRVSKTHSDNFASGKFTPFMCTARGRKVISKLASHRALTDNPMKRPEVASAPKLRAFRSARMKALWADRATVLKRLGRDVNHRVVSVSELNIKEDVYCMEVPETGWFFANNVLVKNCTFCCINAPFGSSSIRFWSPNNVLQAFAELAEVEVTHVKIPDEMFVLNPRHVEDICEGLIQLQKDTGHEFNIWAYARVDTLKNDRLLDRMKLAGFNWLGIGVESGSKHVRDGVEKGKFSEEDIYSTIKRVQKHGIHVAANYIFGLPDDTMESMEQTLKLAIALNTEWANFYCAMAYPGSQLHILARQNKWLLPEDAGVGWIGYSQHAYETLPLETESLQAQDVLGFRDSAFMRYFQRQDYFNMLKRNFGDTAVLEVVKMLSAGSPKRKILGN